MNVIKMFHTILIFDKFSRKPYLMFSVPKSERSWALLKLRSYVAILY